MPAHVSIATAIDKGKLNSSIVYIGLIEIDIIDRATGGNLATLRLAHNNEPYIFRGETYTPCGLTFKVNHSRGEMPSIDLEFVDITLTLQGLLQEYQGGVDFPVRLLVVSSQNPDAPELEERFTILSARAGSDTYNVTVEVGAENPLGMRFPWRLMSSRRCFWKYRGTECGYTGGLPTCDFTLNGPNGCSAHNNEDNFGGFPGIRAGGSV